ncbi:hypothetical protein AAGF08_03200 [Algoriphagus sp. SE2]|uniref:hypothetical protein n=1 Tax=Algoriphagus sp. SE2 TaxID=3141536 RepID=UPI0031CD8059
MNKYKNLHLWMLFPFIIMQAGIFPFYWPTFSQEYWGVHVHYWLASTWYFFLISQPYLATHGKLEKHRTNGIIGFFIAGGVIFSAIVMLMGDMHNAGMIENNPESSNLTPEFLYGVVVIELILITAFIYSIVQAIVKRKNLEEHAWWLIAGLFYIMMPAVGRGFFFVIAVLKGGLFEVPLYVPNNIATAVIISMLLLFAWKYKKLNHQATWIGIAINLTTLLHRSIGSSEAVQSLLKSMILYRP